MRIVELKRAVLLVVSMKNRLVLDYKNSHEEDLSDEEFSGEGL